MDHDSFNRSAFAKRLVGMLVPQPYHNDISSSESTKMEGIFRDARYFECPECSIVDLGLD